MATINSFSVVANTYVKQPREITSKSLNSADEFEEVVKYVNSFDNFVL